MDANFAEPIRKVKIYEEIVNRIHSLMSQGKIKPGDQLPTERDLAQIFGVSRASVREALRVLELAGWVEIRPGSGTYARQMPLNGLVHPLASVLVLRKDLMAQLLEVRKILEPASAAYAAQRASAEDIADLHTIIKREREQVAHGALAVEEDIEFHYTVATSSKNEIIVRIVEMINDLLHESRMEWLAKEDDRPHIALEGHSEIIRAIEKGDAEAASKAMLKHLTDIEERKRKAGEITS